MHELISTMLSHRTTHANEEKAYYQMLDTFGDWEGVLQAPLEELIETLSPAQFPGQKAPRIQQVLQAIKEKSGGKMTIDFLEKMPVEEALQWLMNLPGIGLKTASLVMLFNFHKPVLPVDTHVYRVSQRVGIIGNISADKAHHVLLEMLPKNAKELFNFHKHLYWHGQRICTFRSPKCSKCPLKEICNYYNEVKQE